VPILDNDIITANRSFVIGVGGFGSGVTSQQKVVTLYNAFNTNTPPYSSASFPGPATTSQTTSGDCTDTGASYWNIGVRGDVYPDNHTGGRLAPQYSFLDSGNTLYPGSNNNNTSPSLTTLSCNGSRVPPEAGPAAGWGVAPGTNESNALPGPVFSLMPSATVDEGNNWINLQWGPLSMLNPNPSAASPSLFNFNPTTTPLSPVIAYVASTANGTLGAYTLAPTSDFYGNPRKVNSAPVDAGAIQTAIAVPAPTLTSVTPGSGTRGTVVNVTLAGTNFTASSAVTVSGLGVTVGPITVNPAGTQIATTFTISNLALLTARNVSVQTAGGTATLNNSFTVVSAAPTVTGVSPNVGVRGTVVPVTITGTNFGATPSVSAGAFSGVTVSGITVNPAGTQITATFTISSGAGLGIHDVRVTTGAGTSAVNANDRFTVQGPTVSAITPISGTRGTTVAVTINGTNLTGASAITAGGSITVNSITVNAAGTQVTANFVIASGATTGARNVRVTTPIGQTPINPAVTFTVQ
jgi:hypothetical protein